MWSATTPRQTKSASAFASWSVQSCAAIMIAPARACRTFRNSTWSRPYPRAGRRWSSIPTIASGCTICPRDRFAATRCRASNWCTAPRAMKTSTFSNAPTAAFDFHLPGHADVIFFGHTHVQGGFAFHVTDGKTRPLLPKYPDTDAIAQWKIELDPGERYLINPGSVGQPRDNDPRAAFALYESRRISLGNGDLLPRPLRHSAGAGTNPGREPSRTPGYAAGSRPLRTGNSRRIRSATPPRPQASN